MGSVLATLVALGAIGLLFALDPGGAIAQSGFPDYRDMDWKQLTAWGFRTIGVGVGLLLVLGLWLVDRPRQVTWQRGSLELATRQRPGLPAAAVSVLEDRKVSPRTLLAAIVEMCQRGALQFECVGTKRDYRYRLSQQGPAQFDWERLIYDSLPTHPTTVQALHARLNEHEVAIGDQLGEYLQRRGLFRDNPIRVMREQFTDGFGLSLLAGALMGVGGGLWLALWLPQWWVNSLIGAVIGCIYWFAATRMNAGMLSPTVAGAYEIGQLLGLKRSLPGPDREVGGDGPDSMLAYAIALDAAQPWLDEAVSAPPWFGSGGATSLQGTDLDVAYHGFMSAPEWGLARRSEGAAETEGVTPETEARGATTEDPPSSRLDDRKYRPPGRMEELKDGGGCGGCFMWVVRLIGIGTLVVAVVVAGVVGLHLISPAVDPCPANSPGIPPPGQLGALFDVIRDECVSVAGEVVSHDVGELVVEIDRGEYVQLVRVHGPAEVFEQASVGRRVHVAGRVREHEDGGYVVRYGVDRGWWGNLRENLPEDVLTS